MPRSLTAFIFIAAAALAAAPSARAQVSIANLQAAIVDRNDLAAADRFLGDKSTQDSVKALDPAAFGRLFARAAELRDVASVMEGAATAKSIRLALLRRPGCAFCQDPVKYPQWLALNLSGELYGDKPASLKEAMWAWETMKPAQTAYATAKKKAAAWATMSFPDRHAVMRDWALAEQKALLGLNPSEKTGLDSFLHRANDASAVLSSHETTDLWLRWSKLQQAAASLANARARVAMGATPKQKALLAQAASAPTPDARLAALAAFFDAYGEKPADLLAAAPPKADQVFDAQSRGLVGEMLKTALMKETEGTFAGDDLKDFYSKVPLTVAFTTTSLSAIGWFKPGTDTLYINERFVEEYVKVHGASVGDLMKDRALMQGLARTFASTFVHEAQHHRQDRWAKDHAVPREYSQADEVEAFQTEGLFVLQKMKTDPKFREFMLAEAKKSSLVAGDLANARRIEEGGPELLERTIPHMHYPEVLTNEGNAWCTVLWHNDLDASISAELARRAAMTPEARAAAEAVPHVPRMFYNSRAEYIADVHNLRTTELTDILATQREQVDKAAVYYAQIRERREGFARLTLERYKMVESGKTGKEIP